MIKKILINLAYLGLGLLFMLFAAAFTLGFILVLQQGEFWVMLITFGISFMLIRVALELGKETYEEIANWWGNNAKDS